jgi:hypothetical protein
MMAYASKQVESEPESYPTTSPAVTLNDVAWQRVEPYIAYRYTPRDVEWIVNGPGEWLPPLYPATISTVEIWNGSGWDDCTPDASPLGGYVLTGWGPYRFSGIVGGGDVPAAVWEAVKRLAAYLAAKPGTAGVRSERIEAGSISISRTRSESWMASALQNSGAADLLRPYRKV